MKTLAVVNPAAARGQTGRLWPTTHPHLEAAIGPFDTRHTTRPMESAEIITDALAAGYTRIVAVGGDGTMNEAVNGWFDAEGQPRNSEAILCPLMMGTGGDLSRTLHGEIRGDVRAVTARFANADPVAIDVGRLTFTADGGETAQRFFINIASFGMGGEVARRVNGSPLFKRLGGKIGFYLATVRTLLTFRRPRVTLTVDEHFNGEFDVRNIAIANGKFHGGGMQIAPNADISDGHFDVVIVGPFGRFEIIRHTARFYAGTHLSHPKISATRGRKVVAESRAAVHLEIDGEPLGRLPATFEMLPGALRILV